jgi:hypothetical protein
LVAVRMTDCSGRPASGVTFELGTDLDYTALGIIRFSFRNNVPTPTALATDDSGLGGFANVPLGPNVVRVFDGNREVGLGTFEVRPSWTTLSEISPGR